MRLCMIILAGLLFTSSVAYADQVFPPENAQECSGSTALVWSGEGNVRCEQVLRLIPGQPSPLVGDYTGDIRGVRAINAYLARGNAQVFGGLDLGGCALPEHPTEAQFVRLWRDPVCAHRFCNALFQTDVNPITHSLAGSCGVDGRSGSDDCSQRFGSDVVINMGCVYPIGSLARHCPAEPVEQPPCPQGMHYERVRNNNGCLVSLCVPD